MDWGLEKLTYRLIEELGGLLKAHYDEVARKDLYPELDPDWPMYIALQNAGCLKVFTARVDGKLVGYWFFIVRKHPHYKTVLTAVDDVLFMDPAYRGAKVFDFCKKCVEFLKMNGVKVVVLHCKLAFDLERLYTGLGGEPFEKSFILKL